jgi:hypothetical protein
MGKAALFAVGGGGLSAAASLAALSGTPAGMPLIYLVPLPVLMVGLSQGATAAFIATASGTVLVASFAGLAAAGIYAGMHGLPSWLMVREALRPAHSNGEDGGWIGVGHILAWLAMWVAIIVIVASLAAGSHGGIETIIRQLLDRAMAMAAPALTDEERPVMVDFVAPLFLGTAGAAWLITMVINGILAQSLLVKSGRAARPSPQWSAVSLPDWLAWPLVGTAALALLSQGDVGYVAHNLAVILATPYFLVGLAVVHALVRLTSFPRLLLVAFYIMLLAFALLAALAVAALGVVEQWVGVRRRFSRALVRPEE